jgi:hypothetical protein
MASVAFSSFTANRSPTKKCYTQNGRGWQQMTDAPKAFENRAVANEALGAL